MMRHLLPAGLLMVATTSATSAGVTDGYLNHDALEAALRDLAAAHGACRLESLGTSGQGRDLHLLTLSGDADDRSRPALLIAAGLDGRHLVGTETALRVARRLLDDHAAVLDDITVYVVPRLNPDAATANLGPVNTDHTGTFRAHDDDHDGTDDENGPLDLDGNGVITMMRRPQPPLDDAATHLPDPAAPRLLKEADPAKGERAVYSIYLEGLDTDGDGAIAEDGLGTVDLDRNFMHRWPEYGAGAGPHQLSESESLAMARFVLEHRNIMAAVVYGRHDNLINIPKGKKKDITGRAPLDLHEDDVAMYEQVAERFKEITGQERAPEEDTAGALHAWLYAQRGIPTFATVVWGRPDASEPEAEEEAGEADGPREKEGEKEGENENEGEGENEGENENENENDEADHAKDEKPAKPGDAEAAGWLMYSDRDRNGAGFVEWAPFDHPTLGPVEIGGFVPGFRHNPPAEELEELAEKQTAFVLDLLERSPRITLEGPTTKRLADGLHEVRFGIVNEGYFPTTTVMARTARSVLPTIVRLSTPVEEIVAGERVSRHWGIDGSGGRASMRWIIRADPGTDVTIEIVSPLSGTQTINVRL